MDISPIIVPELLRPKDDFKADKEAWNKWWTGAGHEAIDPALLKPYVPPTEK